MGLELRWRDGREAEGEQDQVPWHHDDHDYDDDDNNDDDDHYDNFDIDNKMMMTHPPHDALPTEPLGRQALK